MTNRLTTDKLQQFSNPKTEDHYERFERRWNQCNKCPLYINAHNYVFFRGRLPCDILLIGEAPGTTEDLLGFPFIGQSGKLLDELVAHATNYYWESYAKTAKRKHPIRIAIANTVCCIPLTEQRSIRPPTPKEVSSCSPRLEEFVGIASPKAIVAVGAVAHKLLRNHPILKAREYLHVHHPAYLLRKGARRDTVLLYKRWSLEFAQLLNRTFPKASK